MADISNKRKADEEHGTDKRTKTKKQWRTTTKYSGPTSIQPGDSGIFATCAKGRESKCVVELRDLFTEYAALLYTLSEEEEGEGGTGVDSIENDIQVEIAGINRPTAKLFTSIRLDVQCVIFFKTIAPIEPVSFVQRICEDAVQKKLRVQARFAQRLTPMTLIGHASVDGLDKVARQVLAPHFHAEPTKPHKFAIRPHMRNHQASPRDQVIRQLATLVGPPHRVDLKEYDLLVLAEFYTNICGISVVTDAYERLKRFNLAELTHIDQDPSPPLSGGAVLLDSLAAE